MIAKRFRYITKRPSMKHQQEGISFGASFFHVPFVVEMRLGKTLMSIRLVTEEWGPQAESEGTLDQPCLVVCPAAVIEAWEKELTLEGEVYHVIQGKSFDKRIETTVNQAFAEGAGRVWILVNPDSLIFTPGLSQLPWFVVYFDESVLIKNPKAKITKLCCNGFRDAIHRGTLTGLNAPEGLLDLFQQYYFLDGHFMGYDNYYAFRNACFRNSYEGYVPKSGMTKKIKQYVHERSFIRTRSEVGLGSKKIREIRTVKMNPQQRKAYDEAEQEFIALIEQNGVENTLETDHVIVQKTWMARIAGGSNALGEYQEKWNGKTKELLYLLRGELKDQPVVVWFRFDSEIKAVEKALRKANIFCETLTGQDTRESKKRKQEWFRTSAVKSRVMLVQELKVAEYGVDMSVSDTAIYYSFVYSGNTIAQTEDRIIHPHKKTPQLYLYLVSEDSIDVDAVEAIRDKVRSSRMFMKKMNNGFLERIQKRYGKVLQ